MISSVPFVTPNSVILYLSLAHNRCIFQGKGLGNFSKTLHLMFCCCYILKTAKDVWEDWCPFLVNDKQIWSPEKNPFFFFLQSVWLFMGTCILSTFTALLPPKIMAVFNYSNQSSVEKTYDFWTIITESNRSWKHIFCSYMNTLLRKQVIPMSQPTVTACNSKQWFSTGYAKLWTF